MGRSPGCDADRSTRDAAESERRGVTGISEADVIVYGPGTQHSCTSPPTSPWGWARRLAITATRKRSLLPTSDATDEHDAEGLRSTLTKFLYFMSRRGSVDLDYDNLVTRVLVNDDDDLGDMTLLPRSVLTRRAVWATEWRPLRTCVQGGDRKRHPTSPWRASLRRHRIGFHHCAGAQRAPSYRKGDSGIAVSGSRCRGACPRDSRGGRRFEGRHPRPAPCRARLEFWSPNAEAAVKRFTRAWRWAG